MGGLSIEAVFSPDEDICLKCWESTLKATQYVVMFDIHLAFCGWVVVSEMSGKKACIGVWVHTNMFPSLEDAFSHSISQLKTKKSCDRKLPARNTTS